MVIDWARNRSLGSSSAGGISAALALCAAGWFTAGARSDNLRAVAALWGGYLVMLAGRSLAAWPDPARRRARGNLAAGASAEARTRWLLMLGWGVSECACYAGLAAGAAAEHWAGVWTLAIAVISLIAVRDLMAACTGQGRNGLAQGGTAARAVDLLLSMPAGGRVLLIGIVAPAWGGRAALFAVLDWAIIAVGYGLGGQAGSSADAQPAGAGKPRTPARTPWPGSLVLLLGPAGQELAPPPAAGRAEEPAAGRAEGSAAGRAEGPAEGSAAGPAAGPGATPRQVRLRDDGELARRLGKPVRGNLLPLPPAILGLAATATLAFLGLRSLPGVLLLAPVLIMVLVSAPGSSNAHSGRLDRLVPAVLLGWQFLYLTAVGQAVAVPGRVTFVLCTALLLRYADLAFPGRPVILARPMRVGEPVRERGTALGWEGRMLLMGAGAAIGIGTYAYLILTAYLVVLLGAKVLTSCLGLWAEDVR
jgi:hypothetical protein